MAYTYGMSKQVSLKIDETILREAEESIKRLGKSRNAYINEAVDYYNKINKKRELRELLVKESAAVYSSSMKILKEMEALEDSLDGYGEADADT